MTRKKLTESIFCGLNAVKTRLCRHSNASWLKNPMSNLRQQKNKKLNVRILLKMCWPCQRAVLQQNRLFKSEYSSNLIPWKSTTNLRTTTTYQIRKLCSSICAPTMRQWGKTPSWHCLWLSMWKTGLRILSSKGFKIITKTVSGKSKIFGLSNLERTQTGAKASQSQKISVKSPVW